MSTIENNSLFPVFLKVDALPVLVIGGGHVAHEKLHFLLKSSPNARVTVVAEELDRTLLDEFYPVKQIRFFERRATYEDVNEAQLVIAAVNNHESIDRIRTWATASKTLLNVADDPLASDFYLGGIVNKGHVKIAISTNGKSPTLAKRLRQFFEGVLPDNLHQLAENLDGLRKNISGDFHQRVTELEKATRRLEL